MHAKPTDLRRKLIDAIDTLSKERLRTAADFIRYLQELESDEATEELLRIPGAVEAIEEGMRDVAEGRAVNWRKVRRDVQG